MTISDRETLEAALIGYEHKKKELEIKIDQLRAYLGGHIPYKPAVGTKGVRSAAVRERMAAAQRRRWAAKKGTDAEPAAELKKPAKNAAGKRAPLSAEARERIAAAQRKRWAASKKAAKNA